MPPKKTIADPIKEAIDEGSPALTKEFYDIQIEELNKRIAKLRSKYNSLEQENLLVKKNLQKVDEDRAAAISYLKRALKNKEDENVQLNEKIKTLFQEKESVENTMLTKIKSLEKQFIETHELHSSEVKLFAGKLNDLEDFKNQRDELLNKFQIQEKEMFEQEKNHKNILYDVEKKYIVSKDRLIQEVEERMVKLSFEFQKAAKVHIAATTQSVIKQNIAINNELSSVSETCFKFQEQNKKIEKEKRNLLIEKEILENECKGILKDNIVQSQVIDGLSFEHQHLFSMYNQWKHRDKMIKNLTIRNSKFEKENNLLKRKVQVLLNELYKADIELQNTKLSQLNSLNHGYNLEKILRETVRIVKKLIGILQKRMKSTGRIQDGDAIMENLLYQLLELTNTNEIFQTLEPNTIPSGSSIIPSNGELSLSLHSQTSKME